LADVVASSVRPFQRLEQVLRRFGSGLQFHFRRQFQTLSRA
jgi:hypothetical protein